MSKEQNELAFSKATNVAEDTNSNDERKYIHSELTIISSDNQSEVSSHVVASTTQQNDANVVDIQPGKGAGASDGSRTSAKDTNKGKMRPSSKMRNMIIERQNVRKEAELKAIAKAKEEERLREEREQQRQKELLLEEERREKKKQKEKQRIQRQKDNGSYVTKRQREKRERTIVQLAAAGIHISPSNATQPATLNSNVSDTKQTAYDDDQKTSSASLGAAAQFVLNSTNIEIEVLEQKKDVSNDDWEQHFEEEENISEKLQALTIIEESSNRTQSNTNAQLRTTTTSSKTESSSSDEDDNDPSLPPMERIHLHLERYHQRCETRRSSKLLRAPIICVLGHVDAGKTTLLDNLRHTNVQNNEAGGITQQIGATNVPLETIRERTKMCRTLISPEGDYIVPGLLIIDTPGHETFANLRSRGSSLCDLAILVVDIMHGLAPQTIESMQLLLEKQTPFIIALNKIDLLYQWKSDNRRDVESVIENQTTITKNHFEKRCNDIIVQFAEQGLNVALYHKNPDPNEYYSMVPTSARSSDGMGSLIAMIIEKCQRDLTKRLSYSDELQAMVMEVKTIDGLGTILDAILVNGRLSVGDRIITAGQRAPIATQIRGLLVPEFNQELRVTNQYQNKSTVKGACGIRIVARDMENPMAGLPLFVARKEAEIDYFKNRIEVLLRGTFNSLELKEDGIFVHTSTLGSLEAFLQLLKTSDIPCAGVNIGSVHRKDVLRASTQLEKNVQYTVILAFDVKVDKDAEEYAKTIGVKIIQHDEIYRLRDQFISYQKQLIKEDQDKHRHLAVFPCKLKILPHCVFNARDPIICGVLVEEGFITLGTPICVPSRDCLDLGRVISIEMNHKPLDIARKGAEVCIKIVSATGELPRAYGRHFDQDDMLVSKISRETIDVVKKYFRDQMQRADFLLMIELKKLFNIA